ncbi:(d)CMP kinase [Asticcacaulis excentricus]|uniref:Cytidylate kinase n=1 Tax=Asticcacaulis excentricus (strain ATCC 15261 / DSM 4724 / KCTC 12464 / NCIMB 9791 / VKM B-1370 / CB 48) TaxID=573065 RepID=E8RNC0_ASTEC|nr:(d)CMP kinase [Asticcacaulis excentricus]ADU14019.1 cytidylate kinase [Asticcacaulis excentricus CB 48]
MTYALIIAFDGPAASGKGTLASVIAQDYDLPMLDTGLIYRAVGFLRAQRGLTLEDVEQLVEIARTLDTQTLDNPELRGREAGEWASQVAALPEVREALKRFQIDFAHQPGGAVLDGRDIGTVIAPDAPVKIFVTARAEVRAHRRWLQLVKSNPDLAYEDVLADIRLRDERDSSRSSAPLSMADDAVLLDTTDLGIEAAIEHARRIVRDRRGSF